MSNINQIQRLYDEYGSISRVSRELKISRHTVRKHLHRIQEVRAGIQKELNPEKQVRTNRVVTAQLIIFVHQKLEENKTKPKKQRLSAIDIHRLAQAGGHQVGYSSVKNIVHDWKEINNSREIYIKQDPPEGYRGEFDWGYVDLNINGSLRKIPLSVFTLNFSQYRFGKLYPTQTSFDVIQAHVDFFNTIVAVPQTLVYDNATTIYDRRTNRYNSTFLSCATHYGFEPKVCNCASPNEKGSCEKSVSVIRRAAFCENHHYQSIDEANAHLASCLEELNNQKVYQRAKVPVQMLEDERPYLLHLPVLEFSNFEMNQATINGYGLVQFQKNFYSVPERYRSKTIFLKIFANRIEMLENDTVVATHNRLFNNGEYSFQILHYLEVLNRKPGSIRHSKLLKHQDRIIQDLFHQYYDSYPKDFLKVINLMKEFSSEKVCQAIKVCISKDIPPTFEMLKLFISEPKSRDIETDAWREFEFAVPDPDLKIFDAELKKEDN